ncbi:MAG TPA: conjugative transposon protein TraN [Cyclobacteriaceae bacterium]|nr:conjugative transposon protein TraN [Cyclobacteriaceae bacterium]HRF32951.1 conjugative transposon protein TraN [Cyclobacteriaceae bacterium]
MLNKIYLSFVLISFCVFRCAVSQSTFESHSLEITYNKTSSVIFPSIIKSVDKGSRDVLAQKAKGVENVLQLKAARENFPETNLTVITADGTLHQFTVNYARNPKSLSIDLMPEVTTVQEGKSPLIFQSDMTESDMEQYAKTIIKTKKPLKSLKEKQYKITLSLNGIYIRDNVIFYHFRVRNQSNINYDVDFLRFFIRDQVKVKRTASQEVDIRPVFVYGDDKLVKGRSTNDIVYALGKFTIPDAKRLVIEMFEKNGGRSISLSIKNKTIVNARLVD